MKTASLLLANQKKHKESLEFIKKNKLIDQAILKRGGKIQKYTKLGGK